MRVHANTGVESGYTTSSEPLQPSYCFESAALLLLQSSPLPAQDSSSPATKKQSGSTSAGKKKKSSASSASQKKSSSAKPHAPRKKSTAARTIKLRKTFVASSDLRPMA